MPSNEPITVDIPDTPRSGSSRGLATKKSMRERQRIRVEKVRYDVKVADPDGGKGEVTKTLLHDVDLVIPPRSLTAIMGSTGAGKTTMLNMLANRIKPTEGTVRVNGKDYQTIPMQRRLGYVMQDDVLMPTQTVREALTFSAKLQLPPETTDEERAQRVEDIISELGLQLVADNMIGGHGLGGRGLSGGERKRVAIGLVLIPDPDILLLDEPTTGLDSFTAESVLDTLGELASAGRTIICTIHQPSSQVFKKFTQLLLMALGHVVYCGAAEKCVDYFTSIGYQCPTYTNPPDFFMKLLRTGVATDASVSLRDTVEAGRNFSTEVAAQWAQCDPTPYLAFDDSQPDTPAGKDAHEVEELQRLHDIEQYSGYAVGFVDQVMALSTRTARNMWRNPNLTRARIVQSMVLGIILGCIFYDSHDSDLGVRAKQGLLFFMMVNQSMLPMMGVLHAFPMEMGLVMRESQASLYSVTAHFVTKTVVELPFLLFFPTLYVVIPYWMVQLRDTANAFWTLVAVLIMVSNVAQSFGLLISAVSPSVDIAMLLGPLIFLPFVLLSGFFVADIPVWLTWAEKCSFVKWGFEAAMLNEFQGRTLDVGGYTNVTYTTGDQILDHLDMNDASMTKSFSVLAGYLVLLRLMTWAVLVWKCKHTTIQQ